MLENIYLRNVEVGRVSEAVLTVDFLYDTGPRGPHRPVLRNVRLENVNSTAAPRVLWVVGFPGVVIEDVRFVNCTFRGLEAAEVLNHAGRITFENVRFEPARRGRSLNSPEAKQ